jgi:hypothetical protein
MDVAIHQQEQGYSASVRLELHAHGRIYELAQVGDGAMILRHPSTVPPGPAQIVVIVAGVRKLHDVVLYPRAPEHAEDEVFFW